MRLILLIPLGLLCGCTSVAPVAALLAAEGASVAVFGRGLVDIGVSAVSGRDCSIVRLDKGQTYCAVIEPLHVERYCTRTLARVDCWADAPQLEAGIADTPPPNAAQLAYRGARWPKSLMVP